MSRVPIAAFHFTKRGSGQTPDAPRIGQHVPLPGGTGYGSACISRLLADVFSKGPASKTRQRDRALWKTVRAYVGLAV